MDKNTIILKQKIMRRVRAIYLLRKIVNPVSLKCAVLLAFTTGVVSVVSTGSIVANMPHTFDIAALFHFSSYAFMNTEILVQAFILGTIGVMLWLARDVAYMVSFTPSRQVIHQ